MAIVATNNNMRQLIITLRRDTHDMTETPRMKQVNVDETMNKAEWPVKIMNQDETDDSFAVKVKGQVAAR